MWNNHNVAEKIETDNPTTQATTEPEILGAMDEPVVTTEGDYRTDAVAGVDEYADPENKKWPLDPEHIKPALSYFNGAKGQDGNDDAKWSVIGHKIASYATKFYGTKYEFNGGKVAKMDSSVIPANTCPNCLTGDQIGKYCPMCGCNLCGDSVVAKVAEPEVIPTIIPADSTNDPCACINVVRLNTTENFCTVCGKSVIYIPDAGLTVSVAVPNNSSSSLGVADAVETEIEEYFVSADNEWQVLTDKANDDSLMKVRQLAMVVDSVNKNKRLYPRKVVMDAIQKTRKAAQMGLVHTKYRHPEVVYVGGKQAFADNSDFEDKTSRVTNIEDPDKLGRVFITRSILPTDKGRAVADDFNNGAPKGLSTRMLLQAHSAALDGETILIADSMIIPTWDDMGIGDRPAVPDTTKYFTLLTDAQLSELDLAVDNTTNTETPRGVNIKETQKKMNPDLKAALDAYKLLSIEEATADAIKDARKDVTKAIRKLAGNTEFDIDAARKALVDADGLFGAPRDQPVIVDAKEIAPMLNNGKGFAEDITNSATPTEPDQKIEENPPVKTLAAAEMDSDLKELLAERKASKAKIALDAEINTKLAAVDFASTPVEVKDNIVETVKKTAKSLAEVDSLVEALLDAYSKGAAKGTLSAMGYGAPAPTSVTVNDPYSGSRTTVTNVSHRRDPMWAEVDQVLAAVDKVRKNDITAARFDDVAKAKRAYNLKIVEPWAESLNALRVQSKGENQFVSALDSLDQFKDAPFAFDRTTGGLSLGPATDATVLSNFYNQPTISTALLVQSYQDLTALEYVQAIGPSNGQGDPNWTSIPNGQGMPGWVLRVPWEEYTNPSGVGVQAVRGNFGSYIGSLAPADNTGIPEGVTTTQWQSFATVPRYIGFSVTRGTNRAAGLGPLNLDLIARHMYHVTYGKNRVLDSAIYFDMLQSSDAFNSVSVTNENVNLAKNSVYNAAGSVTVNLNPAKNASAAPASPGTTTSADPFITYGANVVAAIRVQGSATPGASGATIFAGTSFGTTPIVHPKYAPDLNQNGSYTVNTLNPLSATVAAAAVVEGYIDNTKQVANFPADWFNGAPGTATFGTDHEIGVLVFTSASGVTGAAGILTSAVTVSYYYATNFDNAIILAGGALDSFNLIGYNDIAQLGFTVTKEVYLNTMLQQIDQSAAKLSSWTSFMQPNLFLSSVNPSSAITNASTFYKLNSPEGTVLFPEDQPSAYADRNGIQICRHNSPWACGDHRGLLTRKGATKYGVGQPSQFNGPFPKYDASSNLIALDAFYLEEYSTIATPLVGGTSSTLQHPSRTLVFRSPLG